MSDFKVMKELVKALICVADAIAGTYKGSNSQGGSGDVYDGIFKVDDGENINYFSFGIKDNDNATKLGDLFTDNFINDFNNANGEIYVVCTPTKLFDDAQTAKDRSIAFSQVTDNGNRILAIRIYGKDYGYDVNLTGEELTKDTPLLKQTIPVAQPGSGK